MTTEELLKEFRKYNFQFPIREMGNLYFENLCLHAELSALRKYTVRQFLQLNGKDDVIKIDEEKKQLIDQEQEVIGQYYGELFRELFADFVVAHGTPRESSSIGEDGVLE
jgi:hypothetical protein